MLSRYYYTPQDPRLNHVRTRRVRSPAYLGTRMHAHRTFSAAAGVRSCKPRRAVYEGVLTTSTFSGPLDAVAAQRYAVRDRQTDRAALTTGKLSSGRATSDLSARLLYTFRGNPRVWFEVGVESGLRWCRSWCHWSEWGECCGER